MKLPASAIVLVLLGSACGHNDADQVSTPLIPLVVPAPVFVTLSGTVTDGTSGAPIAAARVSLPESLSFPSTVGSTTDEKGHYQISGLPDGFQYWVIAATMGYLSRAPHSSGCTGTRR